MLNLVLMARFVCDDEFAGDGLVNSADTGVVGDTNGDGVVDGLDTGLVGKWW